MAMTTINTGAAQTATNNIRSRLNSQLEILESYKGFIAQLQANWGGESYNAFVATFERLSPNMRKKLEEMNGYNDEIIRLLGKMLETDNNSARWFEAV
jgi:WXG100 family type VII secretion target